MSDSLSVPSTRAGAVPRQRIMLIGGGREALDLFDDARALGLDVLNINSKSQFKEAFLPRVEHAFITDYTNIDVLVPVARALQAVLPFERVISLSEEGLLPAAHVGDALGLPGNSLETVRMLKDKARMRARLDEVGLSPVLARVGRSREDIVAFVAEHGAPAIVKPVDGARSFGVFRIAGTQDIGPAADALAAAGIGRFLIEEYLDGPEISVESFSFAGRHIIVAITDKLILDNHVEIGHTMPSQIGADACAKVEALVTEFLDALQLHDGPAHTEIKLTRRGPRIIESHNRVGGDRINELLRIAYGVSLKSLTLAWACGLAEAMSAPPPMQSAVAIRFFAPPPGVVTGIGGIDAVRAMPGFAELRLSVQAGDRIQPIRSSDDRAGHVIASGRDVAEAVERCERMLREIHIATA